MAFCSGQLEQARLQSRAAALVDPYNSPLYLETAARSALWAGDAVGAAEDLAELDARGRHAPITDLRRQGIRAGLPRSADG